MDYKKILQLFYGTHLSSRGIASVTGDSKSAINDFLKRFRESTEFTYPLAESITNELIEDKLYHKTGPSVTIYRDFDKELVYRALARKGETLKHLWQKYNAVGVVDSLAPLSYRQYCRRYSEWLALKKVTIHIPHHPGINLELDYAGKTLVITDSSNPEHTTKVTIFIATLSYSKYFYAEGMTKCEIKDWLRVNNHALDFFGGVTATVTPDNCKVAVTENKDWINPALNKDFQAWAEHNDTVITPAKVKSPTWKPAVENTVGLVTMHILIDMAEMTFYSLEELNKVLWEKVAEENRKNFEGLNYSRFEMFENEEKETLHPLPETHYEYLERKVVTVAQDFSFTFDKVHYTMPRKYLRQQLEIRAGEKTIYVYNKHGDLIREHQRSYTPKSWVVIPSDMPKEYNDYGYWNAPYFLNKASGIGPSTKAVIDAVIKKFKYPVQSFRSCFGILRFAQRYSPATLEMCCEAALKANRCNYTYISNTISAFQSVETEEKPKDTKQAQPAARGIYQDDDSRYSLENLLKNQEENNE